MNSIRFGVGREYQFFRHEDILRRWDLRTAVEFLNRFRTDAVAMANFRRQLGKGLTTPSAQFSDDQVIQSIARMMVTGDILIVPPQRHIQHDPPREPAAVAAVSPAKPASRTQAEEDEPTFESDHDGVAQAAVLIAAAREGFPFCEECAKHAAQQRSNSPSSNNRETASPAPPAPSTPSPSPAARQRDTTTAPSVAQPIAQKEQQRPPAPVTPAPPPETKTHWVEIQLVGEDDQPIPNEEFLIELPDGTRRTGVLDSNGLARFDGLQTSGTCKVCFPKLDGDAWDLIPTQSKTTAAG